MGQVVVGSNLPVCPSPGADRPAIDTAMCSPLASALTTLPPYLLFGFCEAFN
jgi:hypothetical protein